ARRGKGGAGSGQGQCGFLLSESRGGEPPACIQSHLPPVAETEAAKAICGGIPGGGQDRPGRENSGGHGKSGQENRQESKRTALFLKRHWKGALIVGGIGLLLVMLLGSLQSCS